MVEISNTFALINPDDIRKQVLMRENISIPGNACVCKSKSKIIFSQNCENGENGPVWRMNFRAVASDASVIRYNHRRAYIGIVMTDGSVRLIGDASSSPMISVTRHGNDIYEVATDFSCLSQVQL